MPPTHQHRENPSRAEPKPSYVARSRPAHAGFDGRGQALVVMACIDACTHTSKPAAAIRIGAIRIGT